MKRFKASLSKAIIAAIVLSCLDAPGFDLVYPTKVFAAGTSRFVTDTYDSYQELLNLITMNGNTIGADGKIGGITTGFLETFNDRIATKDFLGINRYTDSTSSDQLANDDFGNESAGTTDLSDTFNWDNTTEGNGSIPDPRDNGIYTFKQRRVEATGQVKSGRWLTDTNYEAMSGTPTTESLFVTLGGSHYLVDLQYRYVTAPYKRTYTFNSKARNYKYYKLNDNAPYNHKSSVHYSAQDSVPYDENSDLYAAIPMRDESGSTSTYYNYAYRYFETEPGYSEPGSVLNYQYSTDEDTMTSPSFTDIAGNSHSGFLTRKYDMFTDGTMSGAAKGAAPVAHHSLRVTRDYTDSSQSDYKPPNVTRAILTKREIVRNINALKKAFYESASKCQDDNYRADEAYYDAVKGLDNNRTANKNTWMYTYGGLVRGNTVDYETKPFGQGASSGDDSHSTSIYDPVIVTYLYDHNNHKSGNYSKDYGAAAVKLKKVKDVGVSTKQLLNSVVTQLKADKHANSSTGSDTATRAFPINFKNSVLHNSDTSFGALSNVTADTTYASYAAKFTGADACVAIADAKNCYAFGAALAANKISQKMNLKYSQELPFASTFNTGADTIDLDNSYGYDELAALYWRAIYNMALSYGCLFYYDEAVELFSMDGKYLPGFPAWGNGNSYNPGYTVEENKYELRIKGGMNEKVTQYNQAVNRNLAALFGYGTTFDYSNDIKVPFAMFPPGGDLDSDLPGTQYTGNKPVSSYTINDILTSGLSDQNSLYTFDMNITDATSTGSGNNQPNNDTAYPFYTQWHMDQQWPTVNDNADTTYKHTWTQHCCGHTVGDNHSWPTPWEDWWHSGTATKYYSNSYYYSRGITTSSDYYNTNVSKTGGQFHICSLDGADVRTKNKDGSKKKSFVYKPHGNGPDGSWKRSASWAPHWIDGIFNEGGPSMLHNYPSYTLGGRSKDDRTHHHYHMVPLYEAAWSENPCEEWGTCTYACGPDGKDTCSYTCCTGRGSYGANGWSQPGWPAEDAGHPTNPTYLTCHEWRLPYKGGGSEWDHHSADRGYDCDSRNWVHHRNNQIQHQYTCEGYAGIDMTHPNAHTSSCKGGNHYHGSVGTQEGTKYSKSYAHSETDFVGSSHNHYYGNNKIPVNQTPVPWSGQVYTANANYTKEGLYKKDGVVDRTKCTISNHINRDYLYTYEVNVSSSAKISTGYWSGVKSMSDSQTISQTFTNTQWLDITSYKIYEMKDGTIGGLSGLLGTPIKVGDMDNVAKVVDSHGNAVTSAIPENRIVTKAVEQLGYTIYNVDNNYTANNLESTNHGSPGSDTETQYSIVPNDVNNMEQLGIVANSWWDNSIGHIGDKAVSYTSPNPSDGYTEVFPYVAYYKIADAPVLKVGELVNNDMAAFTLEKVDGDNLVFNYNPYAQGGRSEASFGSFVAQALAHTLYFKKASDWRTRSSMPAISYGNHLRIQSDYLSLERVPQSGEAVNRLTLAGAMHDMWDERGIKTGDDIYSSGKFSLLPNGFNDLSVYLTTDGWIPARMSAVLCRTSMSNAYQTTQTQSSDDCFMIHSFCAGINQATHNSWDQITPDSNCSKGTERDLGGIGTSKSFNYSPYSATNADNGVSPVSSTVTRGTFVNSSTIRLSDIIYTGMQNGFWASFESPRTDMSDSLTGTYTGVTPAYSDSSGNIFVVGDYYLNESQNYAQVMTDRRHLQTHMPYVGYQSQGDGTRDIDRDGDDTSKYQKGYDPGYNNIYDTRETFEANGNPEEYSGAKGFSRFGASGNTLIETTHGDGSSGMYAGGKSKYGIGFSKYYPNISDVNVNRYLPNNEYAIGQATVNYQLKVQDDDKTVYGTQTVTPYKSILTSGDLVHIPAHYFRRGKGTASTNIDDSKAIVPAADEGTSTTIFDKGSEHGNDLMSSRINSNLIDHGVFEYLNDIVIYNPVSTESAHVVTASKYLPDAANQGTNDSNKVEYTNAYLKSFEEFVSRDTRLGYTYNKLNNTGGKEQYVTGNKILTVKKQVADDSTFIYKTPSSRVTTAYVDSDYNSSEVEEESAIKRIWDNPSSESTQLETVDILESGSYTLALANRLNHKISIDLDLQAGDTLEFYKGDTNASNTGWDGRNQAVYLNMGNDAKIKWKAYKKAYKQLQQTTSNSDVKNYPESSMDVGLPLYNGTTFAVGTGSLSLRKGALLKYQVSVSNTYHVGYKGIKNAIAMADLHNDSLIVNEAAQVTDPDNANATLYTWYIEAKKDTTLPSLYFTVSKDCFIWSSDSTLKAQKVFLAGVGRGSNNDPVDSLTSYELLHQGYWENAWSSTTVRNYYNKFIADISGEYTFTDLTASTIVRMDLVMRQKAMTIGMKSTIEDPHIVPNTDWRHFVVGWSTDGTGYGTKNGVITSPFAVCLFEDTTKLYLPSGKAYEPKGYVTVADMKKFVSQGRLAAFLSNSSTWELFLLDDATISDPNGELHGELTSPHTVAGNKMSNMFQGYKVSTMKGWNYTFSTAEYGLKDRTNRLLPVVHGDNYKDLKNVTYNIIFRCTDHPRSDWSSKTKQRSWIAYDVRYTTNRKYKYTLEEEASLIANGDKSIDGDYWDWKVDTHTRLVFSEDALARITGTYQSLDDEFNIYWDNYSNIIAHDQALTHTNQNGEGTSTNLRNTTIWLGRGWDNLSYSQNHDGPNGALNTDDHLKIPETWKEVSKYGNGFWKLYGSNSDLTVTDTTKWLYAKYVIFNMDMYAFCPKPGVSYVYDSKKIDEYIDKGLWDPTTPAYMSAKDSTSRKKNNGIIYIPAGERVFLGYYDNAGASNHSGQSVCDNGHFVDFGANNSAARDAVGTTKSPNKEFYTYHFWVPLSNGESDSGLTVQYVAESVNGIHNWTSGYSHVTTQKATEEVEAMLDDFKYGLHPSKMSEYLYQPTDRVVNTKRVVDTLGVADKYKVLQSYALPRAGVSGTITDDFGNYVIDTFGLSMANNKGFYAKFEPFTVERNTGADPVVTTPKHKMIDYPERYGTSVTSSDISIVGRLGGLVTVDTEDPRYQDTFKWPDDKDETTEDKYNYAIAPIVHAVSHYTNVIDKAGSQRRYLYDVTDVRGRTLADYNDDTNSTNPEYNSARSSDTYYISWYLKNKQKENGIRQNWASPADINFNIHDEMRYSTEESGKANSVISVKLGYNLLCHLNTIGNYFGSVQKRGVERNEKPTNGNGDYGQTKVQIHPAYSVVDARVKFGEHPTKSTIIHITGTDTNVEVWDMNELVAKCQADDAMRAKHFYSADVYMRIQNNYSLINAGSEFYSIENKNEKNASSPDKGPYYLDSVYDNAYAVGLETNSAELTQKDKDKLQYPLDQNMLRLSITTIESQVTYDIVKTYKDEWKAIRNRIKPSILNREITTTILDRHKYSGVTLGDNIDSKYYYGNGQMLFLREYNRNFVGGPSLALNEDSVDLDESLVGDAGWDNGFIYTIQRNSKIYGQRWYFHFGLPASAVFVKHGTTPINGEVLNSQVGVYVVSMIDCYAIGNKWTVHYESESSWQDVVINSANIPYELWNTYHKTLPHYIPVCIYDMSQASASNDLSSRGSH